MKQGPPPRTSSLATEVNGAGQSGGGLSDKRELDSERLRHKSEVETLREMHVDELNDLTARLAEAERRVRWLEMTRSVGMTMVPDLERVIKRYPESPRRSFVAKYQFYPDTPPKRLAVDREMLAELYIREGDTVDVEGEMRPDGYYVANIGRRRGLAPAAHLEPLNLSVERSRADVLALLALPTAPPTAAPRSGLRTMRVADGVAHHSARI
mmetsp:Transcript_4323/g.11000  ORF Transcript_4323/g.11000 Transcript_4323/m.11000 type:complete len:211 (-) Transcript_4323:50-682(-)